MRLILLSLLLGLLLLVLCGCTSPVSPLAGDPDHGHELFVSHCSNCHILASGPSPTGPPIGPNLENLATKGATRKAGMSASAYIRESITDHNAFIVPGTPVNLPANAYDELQKLSRQEVEDLVAFVLTLR
jgi:mono/diheme cytochrome c family protein